MGLLDVFRRKPPALPSKAADAAPAAPGAPRSMRLADGLFNAVAGLGTDRDKRSYSTYGYVYRMNQPQLEALYEGSWLGGKIIDIPAGDSTRQWVSRTWEGADKDEIGRKALTTAEAGLDVRGKVRTALTWARLHGGAVIFLAIAADLDVSKPLDTSRVTKGALRNLIVLDRWRVSASPELDGDLNSPNFGLPLYYTISESQTRVHWTRMVRFDGVTLPHSQWLANGRWNGSVLQRIADSIKNYDSSRDIAGSMMYEAVVDVLKIANLYAMLSQPGGEAEVATKFQSMMLMKGVNRSVVIDKEDDYEQKTMAFGGVVDILREFAVDVCGAADIPMTRLFGQSPGGLNSTGQSDVANYDDKVKADQESQLRPRLERIDAVLLPSAIGRMPKDYELTFNPLRQMTDAEQADLENKRADRDKKYVDMGALTGGGVARELNQEGTYHTMTEEDVQLAEENDDAKAEMMAQQMASKVPVGEGSGPLAIGDRVTVIPGKEHMAEHKGVSGTVKIVQGQAIGIKFDGIPGVHKWYAPDELQAEPADGSQGETVMSMDSLPGDKIEHKTDGWHAYAAGKHIGGPYKTRAKALRTLRRHEKYDRR